MIHSLTFLDGVMLALGWFAVDEAINAVYRPFEKGTDDEA